MQLVNYAGPHTLPKEKKRSKAEVASVKRTAASTEKYRAVKDYNPDQFSRSGHRRLELPLKEGDIVKVLGMLSFSEEKNWFLCTEHGRRFYLLIFGYPGSNFTVKTLQLKNVLPQDFLHFLKNVRLTGAAYYIFNSET